MRRWMLMVPLSLSLVAGLVAEAAAVPDTMHFTARIRDSGEPIDGSVNLSFKLYDDESSSSGLLWEESHTLVADQGLVSVELGSSADNGLDAAVFGGGEVWLELTINGVIQSPRVAIGAVPYAIAAATAELLGPLAPGDVQQRGTIGSQCTGAEAIRTISADGTPDCVSLPEGDITAVNAGTGLSGGGTGPGSVTLSANTSYLQRRGTLGTGCGTTKAIRSISADGTPTCESIPQGDVTGITASAPLTGGGTGGSVTIGVDTSVVAVKTGSSDQCFDGDSLCVDFSSNRIGVGTNSPDYTLDVDGDVRADSYRFGSSVTRYHPVPAAAFVGGGDFNSDGYLDPGTAGGWSMRAPVHLPDGATVTELRCYTRDNSGPYNVTWSFFLGRLGYTSDSSSTLASLYFTTVGSSTSITTTTDNSIGYSLVNSGSYTYFIRFNASLGGNCNNTVHFMGCRVGYTMTTLNLP